MAGKDETARRLAEAHRLAQNKAVQAALPGIDALWPVLDQDEQLWLSEALELVLSGRDRSRALAVTYFRSVLELHGVPVATVDLAGDPNAAERIITSLRTTGPVWKAMMLANHDPAFADVSARRKVLGAAIRHVLDAGREELVGQVNASDYPMGWRRIGAPGACDHCREYIDGDIIPGEAGRGYDFPVHDNCGCTVEPVFI